MIQTLLSRPRFIRGRVPVHPPSSSYWRGILSVQAMSHVIENSKHKGNHFVVLLMIANHARSDGTLAYPSTKTLARESRINRRTVQRVIKRLASGRDAELEIIRGGGRRCNSYTVRGVKLSPPQGRQNAASRAADTVIAGAARVSPEPSYNRPRRKERTQNRRASCVGLNSNIYPNGY